MISIISDVHIKNPGDRPSELLLKFLKHEKVEKSGVIVFLGDIFDLLIGGDKVFKKEYESIFNLIEELLKKNKEIFYIEGNHDFHLHKFFRSIYKYPNFKYCNKLKKIERNGLRFLFCHGDDIEIDNPSYKRYSLFIRSSFIRIITEDILPFRITKKVGEHASKRSRKKNFKKYEAMTESIREKFRRSAEEAFKISPVDFIIAGHSHVKDEFNSPLGFIYLNNGYVPKEETFLYIENEKYEFVSLA